MNNKYPKFLCKSVETGNCEFLDFYTAASRQNSWFSPWEVLDQVLEENGSVRDLTAEEARKINILSDEIDASK